MNYCPCLLPFNLLCFSPHLLLLILFLLFPFVIGSISFCFFFFMVCTLLITGECFGWCHIIYLRPDLSSTDCRDGIWWVTTGVVNFFQRDTDRTALEKHILRPPYEQQPPSLSIFVCYFLTNLLYTGVVIAVLFNTLEEPYQIIF